MNREARILSGLHALTPHVVDVLDAGVTADAHRLPFIVMEKLAGMTLRDSIRRRASKGRPFTILEVVHICLEMTTALAFAHENEIVHRDIKPENAFLHRGREGEKPSVRVLDFGISEWTDGDAADWQGVKGTVRYMAPEQFRRGRVTPPADVYAMGLVAFELLTLEHPFEIGARKLERAEFEYVHCSVTPPRVSEFRTDVPPSLLELIAACLEKDPARRPQSGGALTKVFKRLRDELQPPRTLSHIAAISDLGSPPFTLDGTTDVGVAPFVPHSPEPPQVVRGDEEVPRGAITSVPGLDSNGSGSHRSEVFVSRSGTTGEPIVPTPTIIVLGASTPDIGIPAALSGLSIDRTIPDPLPPFGCDEPPPTPRVLFVVPSVPDPPPAVAHPRPMPTKSSLSEAARVDSFVAEQARIEHVREHQEVASTTPRPSSATPSLRPSDLSSEGQSVDPVTDETPVPPIAREWNPWVLPTVVFSGVVAAGTALAWMFTFPASTAPIRATAMSLPTSSFLIVNDAPPPPPAISASVVSDASSPAASAPSASARAPQRALPWKPASGPPSTDTSDFKFKLPSDTP